MIARKSDLSSRYKLVSKRADFSSRSFSSGGRCDSSILMSFLMRKFFSHFSLVSTMNSSILDFLRRRIGFGICSGFSGDEQGDGQCKFAGTLVVGGLLPINSEVKRWREIPMKSIGARNLRIYFLGFIERFGWFQHSGTLFTLDSRPSSDIL